MINKFLVCHSNSKSS